jgi:ABC-type transport system substrate-binding protein
MDIQDILFTWERWTRVASDRSSIANSVNPNAPVLSFTATDDRTLVVKLKEPLVYLMQFFSKTTSGIFGIIPKETDSTFDIRRNMIGTGAFELDEYVPSASFRFKRNAEYYDKTMPYVDYVEAPIVREYAQGMAQFRAGNTYTYSVRGEDIFVTKRDVPDLLIYQNVPSSFQFGSMVTFGYQPGSPFLDERVRQAFSLSYDRDLFIDTFGNAANFRNEGLPVETYWYTSMGPIPGWWIDPRDEKAFGPNAKYYKYDIAEAKKLLAAAGFPNGIKAVSTMIAGTETSGVQDPALAVRENMLRDAGIEPQPNIIDYTTEYLPKYRDGQGRFDGYAYTTGSPFTSDAVGYYAWRFFSKTGQSFIGFDSQGRGDGSGDPYVDSQILKARGEFDTEKRKVIIHDLQKHLAKAMYGLLQPGTASGFNMAWPVLGNFKVIQGDRRPDPFSWWLDDTKAPLTTA